MGLWPLQQQLWLWPDQPRLLCYQQDTGPTGSSLLLLFLILKSSRALILYSKPGCCLCDGLKEKLQAAFLLFGPDSIHDVDLQIRDITSNPEWEKAYQYEIPVLARVLSDGTELPSLQQLTVGPISTIRKGPGRWIKHIDHRSGEEHLFRE